MKAVISTCIFVLLALHLTQGCPWMQHKFGQHSRKYLSLLKEMVSVAIYSLFEVQHTLGYNFHI